MGTTTASIVFRPASLRADDDKFVDLATQVGEACAASATDNDQKNLFAAENFELLRESGYLRLLVPEELGGLGATLRQAVYAQAELARHDGSTALAVNMHLYATALQCYRRAKGAADAEGVLKRIAAEGIVIAVSGGSDWLWPTAVAVRENGGFLVSGRKVFCSQAPAAAVLATSATYDDPEKGRQVLHFSAPFSAPGVRVEETWDAMGMRATGSHDVVLEDFVVAEDKVVGTRPYGVFGPPLFGAVVHFAPLVASVYYGVAVAARNEAVRLLDGRERGGVPAADLPATQRQVGLMDAKLRTSWWALMGSLAELGDGHDYVAGPETANTVMIAKRMVVTEAIEIASLAMDAVGGQAYLSRCLLERLFRDVRAGTFHPFTPEATLYYAGRLALGGDVDTE